MRIALGSDHRGFKLKQQLATYMSEAGYVCADIGCHDESSVDYPDIAEKVSREVSSGRCRLGILVCGTGIGMSMAANKVRDVRAALCHDRLTGSRSRQHNDANVLCLGSDVVDPDTAKAIVDVFLTTSFEGGRHEHRLGKMRDIEARKFLDT